MMNASSDELRRVFIGTKTAPSASVRGEEVEHLERVVGGERDAVAAPDTAGP